MWNKYGGKLGFEKADAKLTNRWGNKVNSRKLCPDCELTKRLPKCDRELHRRWLIKTVWNKL